MKYIIIVLICLALVACTPIVDSEYKGVKAVVYKSPLCGCCVGYSAFLEQQGFDVETVELFDMQPIKDKYNIPQHMESCHTTVIGDYFIEGHVPLEGIQKLLIEKPDIKGISLPRMPAGTPGMPGVKQEPYVIYQFTEEGISEYMII